ncbi:MAG: hypothetical protein IPJ06_17565 [Saprospiraceae bacterium]|nr:hypothetical protein [Saprospiraceae bacterium]
MNVNSPGPCLDMVPTAPSSMVKTRGIRQTRICFGDIFAGIAKMVTKHPWTNAGYIPALHHLVNILMF